MTLKDDKGSSRRNVRRRKRRGRSRKRRGSEQLIFSQGSIAAVILGEIQLSIE